MVWRLLCQIWRKWNWTTIRCALKKVGLLNWSAMIMWCEELHSDLLFQELFYENILWHNFWLPQSVNCTLFRNVVILSVSMQQLVPVRIHNSYFNGVLVPLYIHKIWFYISRPLFTKKTTALTTLPCLGDTCLCLFGCCL